MTKKYFKILLVCCLAVSLTACGKPDEGKKSKNNEKTEQSGKESPSASGSEDESASEAGNQESEVLTLEDTKARLVCADGSFVTVAVQIPRGHSITMHFCRKDGSDLEKEAFLGYGNPSPGWKLAITTELAEEYSIADLGISVTDHSAEKTADGTYPSIVLSDFGDPMTEEELKAIGFSILDGHPCLIGDGRGIYAHNNFGFTFGITWFDGYRTLKFEEIEGFADRWAFFAGDGTPLEEYFEGYSTMKVEPLTNMFDVLLYQDDSKSDKEKNKSMCDELKACKPYAVYTGADGTTQKFPLMQD